MIDFDPAKDEINRAKHGISLEAAERMGLSAAIILPEERFAYGEDRFQALGRLARGCMCLSTPCAANPSGPYRAGRQTTE